MKQTPPYSAPAFTLMDASGAPHSLSDYKGKWVVLYFYPKDDTPGCTIEACSFRDANEALLAQKAVVIGISGDDNESHQAFQDKYQLNFTLLVDPAHKTTSEYGAWGKKMFGIEGVQRKTFIIDPAGRVVKVYGRVTPLGHGEKVLADLRELQHA